MMDIVDCASTFTKRESFLLLFWRREAFVVHEKRNLILFYPSSCEKETLLYESRKNIKFNSSSLHKNKKEM